MRAQGKTYTLKVHQKHSTHLSFCSSAPASLPLSGLLWRCQNNSSKHWVQHCVGVMSSSQVGYKPACGQADASLLPCLSHVAPAVGPGWAARLCLRQISLTSPKLHKWNVQGAPYSKELPQCVFFAPVFHQVRCRPLEMQEYQNWHPEQEFLS